jgi:DNA-binding PadR family transcriptional regulator
MVQKALLLGIKENSIKNHIITMLSINWPLSINQIHKELNSKNKVSYQAIHKAIKQLEEAGYVVGDDREYQINLSWIERLNELTNLVLKNYRDLPNTSKRLNTITIRNNYFAEDIRIYKVRNLLEKLIPIYRSAFKEHNIFKKKSTKNILSYLMNLQEVYDLVLFLVHGEVVGGVVIIKEEEDKNNDYIRWRFKHFAFKSSVTLKEGIKFIVQIEKKLSKLSEKIKIEYNMAENEEEYVNLFKKAGYKKESTIKDRYRYDELAYVYSKTL